MAADLQTPTHGGLAAQAPAVQARSHQGLRAALRATGWPGLLIGALIVIALLGPLAAPQDPLATNPLTTNATPFTDGFILGTDGVGRDTLSRLLYGARLSLLIGLLPVLVATIVSLALAFLVVSGPRPVGFGVMRLTDVFLAFPGVMLALAVAAMLGPNLRNAMIALTIVLIPLITRIARAAALDVTNRPYVAAARMAGASRTRQMIDVVLPNMLPTVLVYAAGLGGLMIVAAASLSFIGVGVQSPTSEWGRMMADGRNDFLLNPWPCLLPGLCIFIASLAMNLTADRLRDHFDPRTR